MEISESISKRYWSTYLPVLACEFSKCLLEHFLPLFGSDGTNSQHVPLRVYKHTYPVRPYTSRFPFGFLAVVDQGSYIPSRVPELVLPAVAEQVELGGVEPEFVTA